MGLNERCSHSNVNYLTHSRAVACPFKLAIVEPRTRENKNRQWGLLSTTLPILVFGCYSGFGDDVNGIMAQGAYYDDG